MYSFASDNELLIVIHEVGEVIMNDMSLFERMTREPATQIKAAIDNRLQGLEAVDYKRIFYLSLWHMGILPKDPSTGFFYTVRDCSNIKPGVPLQDRKIISSVHKFYLQIRGITEVYVHPQKQSASTNVLLSALKEKAPQNMIWQDSISCLVAQAEALEIS